MAVFVRRDPSFLAWPIGRTCGASREAESPVLRAGSGQAGQEPALWPQYPGGVMGPQGGWAPMHQQRVRGHLNHCRDLDQLTQILKVTGVPGAEFVQKLNDKAVGSKWPELAWAMCLADLGPLG